MATSKDASSPRPQQLGSPSGSPNVRSAPSFSVTELIVYRAHLHIAWPVPVVLNRGQPVSWSFHVEFRTTTSIETTVHELGPPSAANSIVLPGASALMSCNIPVEFPGEMYYIKVVGKSTVAGDLAYRPVEVVDKVSVGTSKYVQYPWTPLAAMVAGLFMAASCDPLQAGTVLSMYHSGVEKRDQAMTTIGDVEFVTVPVNLEQRYVFCFVKDSQPTSTPSHVFKNYAALETFLENDMIPVICALNREDSDVSVDISISMLTSFFLQRGSYLKSPRVYGLFFNAPATVSSLRVEEAQFYLANRLAFVDPCLIVESSSSPLRYLKERESSIVKAGGFLVKFEVNPEDAKVSSVIQEFEYDGALRSLPPCREETLLSALSASQRTALVDTTFSASISSVTMSVVNSCSVNVVIIGNGLLFTTECFCYVGNATVCLELTSVTDHKISATSSLFYFPSDPDISVSIDFVVNSPLNIMMHNGGSFREILRSSGNLNSHAIVSGCFSENSTEVLVSKVVLLQPVCASLDGSRLISGPSTSLLTELESISTIVSATTTKLAQGERNFLSRFVMTAAKAVGSPGSAVSTIRSGSFPKPVMQVCDKQFKAHIKRYLQSLEMRNTGFGPQILLEWLVGPLRSIFESLHWLKEANYRKKLVSLIPLFVVKNESDAKFFERAPTSVIEAMLHHHMMNFLSTELKNVTIHQPMLAFCNFEMFYSPIAKKLVEWKYDGLPADPETSTPLFLDTASLWTVCLMHALRIGLARSHFVFVCGVKGSGRTNATNVLQDRARRLEQQLPKSDEMKSFVIKEFADMTAISSEFEAAPRATVVVVCEEQDVSHALLQALIESVSSLCLANPTTHRTAVLVNKLDELLVNQEKAEIATAEKTASVFEECVNHRIAVISERIQTSLQQNLKCRNISFCLMCVGVQSQSCSVIAGQHNLAADQEGEVFFALKSYTISRIDEILCGKQS